MSGHLEKPTRDEIIGKNLANLRGQRSQQVVADAMRRAGHKWSQATVWSVEKGERPLRLSEAESLAGFLDIQVGDLLKLPRWYAFFDLQSLIDRRSESIRAASEELEYYTYLLAKAADALALEAGDAAVASEMTNYRVEATPDDALAEIMRHAPVRRSDSTPGHYLTRFLDARRDRPSLEITTGGEDGEHQAEA